MKRTTIFLAESLLRRAQKKADAEGRSFAWLVREAVAAYISRPKSGRERLPSLAGAFDTPETDISERVEELLWNDPSP